MVANTAVLSTHEVTWLQNEFGLSKCNGIPVVKFSSKLHSWKSKMGVDMIIKLIKALNKLRKEKIRAHSDTHENFEILSKKARCEIKKTSQGASDMR